MRKLLSKIDDRFIYHFEFKVDSHYLVFQNIKKCIFMFVQKNRNKPLNKSSNKLLYNYVQRNI